MNSLTALQALPVPIDGTRRLPQPPTPVERQPAEAVEARSTQSFRALVEEAGARSQRRQFEQAQNGGNGPELDQRFRNEGDTPLPRGSILDLSV